MTLNDIESSFGKSDIIFNGIKETPVVTKKPKNNDEFANYIRNNYPRNMCGKLKYNFYDEEIFVDFIQNFYGHIRYFFFNLDKLHNQLNSLFDKIFEQNPSLSELKKDLSNYIEKYQTELFQEEELNIGQKIYQNVYYLIKPEQSEIDIMNKNKVIHLAFLLMQLENLINLRNSGNIFIVTLRKDLKEKGFNVYGSKDFPVLIKIHKDIENMRSSSDEECINLLYAKTKNLFEEIIKDKNISNENKNIFIMYLLHFSNEKLLLLENLIHNMPINILNKIYNLRKYINDNIIKYGFDKQTNQKYFFDIEFSYFKIIKDTLYEKEIFLEKVYLNDFLVELKNDFNNTKQIIFLNENDIPEREENLSFIEKYLKNLENQDTLKDEIQKKIDEFKNKKYKNIINIGKNGISFFFGHRKGLFEFFGKKVDERVIKEENAIFENAMESKQNIEIENREISKLKKIIENVEVNKVFIIKLIKEYDLKTQIEKIIEENKNLKGIIINQKINDKENKLRDKYTVLVVN